VALAESGHLYAWGAHNNGRLGLDSTREKARQCLKGSGVRPVLCTSLGCRSCSSCCCGGRVCVCLCVCAYGVVGVLRGHDVRSTDAGAPRQLAPTLLDTMAGKQARLVACGRAHAVVTVTHGWVPDHEATDCMGCKRKFTQVRRRVRVGACVCLSDTQTQTQIHIDTVTDTYTHRPSLPTDCADGGRRTGSTTVASVGACTAAPAQEKSFPCSRLASRSPCACATSAMSSSPPRRPDAAAKCKQRVQPMQVCTRTQKQTHTHRQIERGIASGQAGYKRS
jgi:hypothetical protein